MRIRTFRVPFSRIVSDAPELEFGPEDYVVLRPVFGQPADVLTEFLERLNGLRSEGDRSDGDRFALDLYERTIVDWHLADEAGEPIPQPRTAPELYRLPAQVSGGLTTFLMGFRGEGPDPTTGSAPAAPLPAPSDGDRPSTPTSPSASASGSGRARRRTSMSATASPTPSSRRGSRTSSSGTP